MSDADARYKRSIRDLSDRLVALQRPIRILDAIKWDGGVRDAFLSGPPGRQPRVDRTYYESRPLGFDPAQQRRELEELERTIVRELGSMSPVGLIMQRTCREYTSVVRMLEARGLPEFGQISQQLYGSAGDAFHAGGATVAELGVMMSEALANIGRGSVLQPDERTITGEEAVVDLQARFDAEFGEACRNITVMVSDGIVADAAAGSTYLKIRKEARFSRRDLRQLEVHEGWVHLGTTLNGVAQPVCTFLSKGPPSSTITQEGLAILVEILAFASHPARVCRTTDRIRAIHMAENGATFLDVFGFFREQGLSEEESFAHSARVYRGSTPTGTPFTKDLAYAKGFVLVYNYVQLAIRHGLLDRIALLFCGKATLEDLRTLAQLVEEGIVVAPTYLPPMIRDLSALTAWMCYSNFLNHLDLERVAADYVGIL